MFAFGAPSAPVANWGVLGFPEALTIYNFIYSRFPSTAGIGALLRRWLPTSAELALGQVAAFIPGQARRYRRLDVILVQFLVLPGSQPAQIQTTFITSQQIRTQRNQRGHGRQTRAALLQVPAVRGNSSGAGRGGICGNCGIGGLMRPQTCERTVELIRRSGYAGSRRSSAMGIVV